MNRFSLICRIEELQHDQLRYLEYYRKGGDKSYRDLAKQAILKRKALESKLDTLD